MAILGSTFDGSYEPVAEICAALDDLTDRTGLDVPVHVDGAAGAMVAPFCDPDRAWDFRLPRVALDQHLEPQVRAGASRGALWRDTAALPEDLIFKVNYLGGQMPTFALNFSRPGGQVVAQYYNYLRLGRDGFRRVQQNCRDVATSLSAHIAELGPFRLLTDGSQLPVFAFVTDGDQPFSVFDVSAGLREEGWLVPAYTFPAHREDIAALRIVVRNGFSHDLADLLLDDLRRVLDRPAQQTMPQRGSESASFSHVGQVGPLRDPNTARTAR